LEFCDKVAGAAVRTDSDAIESLMAEEVDGEPLEAIRRCRLWFRRSEKISKFVDSLQEVARDPQLVPMSI
jgi:hypothetical protein